MSTTISSLPQDLYSLQQDLTSLEQQAQGSSVFFTNALAGTGAGPAGMPQSGAAPTPSPPPTSTKAVGGADGTEGTPDPSQGLSSQDTQSLLNGDYSSSQPQNSKATCPDNVSMDQLMNADGGLLAKMGNQQLEGDGAKGISGGILDNLAKAAGGQPGDIGKNKDVTMRALMIAESAKNVPGSDGKMLPADARHNGNMSGLTKSNEVIDGSDMAHLQNLFKDPQNFKFPAQRDANAKLHSDGTEKSGAEEFGDHVKDTLEAPFKAIGSVIEGMGHGIKDLFTGHANDAFGDVAKGVTGGVKDIVDPVTQDLSGITSHIPVFGKALSSDISAVGSGIDHIQDGMAKAADDVGHGQFGKALSDAAGGYKTAASGVTNSVLQSASNIISQVPGLRNSSLADGIAKGSDWLSGKATGLINSSVNLVTNPLKDMGQMATDGFGGNWSAVGQDAESWAKDGAELGVAVGAGLATGGTADVGLAGLDMGADAAAGDLDSAASSGLGSADGRLGSEAAPDAGSDVVGTGGAQGGTSALTDGLKGAWKSTQGARDTYGMVQHGNDASQNFSNIINPNQQQTPET